MDRKPNPGSPEAIAQGCRCPRMDNCNGRGAYTTADGTPIFYMTSICPLHGYEDPQPPHGGSHE